MSLKQYFDRVVVINLKRRPDRLERLHEALKKCDWPFKRPQVFHAIDGHTIPVPRKFKSGPGAWGCNCSHRMVMEEAISDGVENLLILEDDVCFVKKFRQEVEKFLQSVPEDWDGLMIGGQHLNKAGPPVLVKPGVYRCVDCERCHCYALRGKYLRKLCRRLKGGGKFDGTIYNDLIMGKDPELQIAHKVYAPQYFLAGQDRTQSDISGMVMPRKFWNPPGPNLPVINLHAPQPLVAVLREHGWFTGHQRDHKSDIDLDLIKIFRAGRAHPARLRIDLREWIKSNQWE
ncbi:MAG TPA: glycosyltransferase family 25 protein, partial [Puia sp.]|nr:glycosyltransferase family 25 protein [Puia sp.]